MTVIQDLLDIITRLLIGVPEPTKGEMLVAFLDRWQTLISGGLALLAAFLTVAQIRHQIAKERKRAAKGARIRVPHALSPLSRYAEECFNFWARRDKEGFPKLPSGPIESLMQIAVDVDDDTFQSIRELVLHAQIIDARAEAYSATDKKPPLNWRETLVHDTLYFKYLIDRLYTYGRDKATSLPFDEPCRTHLEDAVPSLSLLGVDYDQQNALHQEIATTLDRYYNKPNTK